MVKNCKTVLYEESHTGVVDYSIRNTESNCIPSCGGTSISVVSSVFHIMWYTLLHVCKALQAVICVDCDVWAVGRKICLLTVPPVIASIPPVGFQIKAERWVQKHLMKRNAFISSSSVVTEVWWSLCVWTSVLSLSSVFWLCVIPSSGHSVVPWRGPGPGWPGQAHWNSATVHTAHREAPGRLRRPGWVTDLPPSPHGEETTMKSP